MIGILNMAIWSPLEQFYVLPGILTIFSNVSIMFFVVFFFLAVVFALNAKSYNFSIFESFVQATMSMQKTTLSENLNITKLIYFPYNYLLFMFIWAANIFGMVPYAYTITSSFIVVLFLSMVTMIGITTIGFVQQGYGFFAIFLPSGTSVLMMPLLFVIEVISYFARVLSLAIRLFANMLSGHVLLKILAGVIWFLLWSGYFWLIWAIAPIAVFFVITGLEIVIACLQAYVFSVLIVIYLNDVINLH